ncbi:cyclodeaminase/cyclohydrolase family protein [Haloarcula litorea]|uniref:cyclodeaminase/cyclohydrolase family protein n=1 Tax=Haloarcula litorea TaxID=3032579 RepID=UPI0023E7D2F0|nr:cyclodeaminase/cyclohydrolase family protein [Halomicroarcula sp. GDY20]
MSEDRVSVADLSIAEFLDAVASRAVAPSAGAVTAVNGAAGAALCEMVAIHTSEPSASLSDARDDLADARQRLLALADDDAAAVDRVQTAFEAETRTDHPEAALRRATEVPLAIARTCCVVVEAAVPVAEEGTRNAAVDTVVGARLARAALSSAATVVRANLELLSDESFVADARGDLDAAETIADEALSDVRTATGIGAD